MSRRIGPCMCGATDCPSCGPAQGYTVARRWDHKKARYVFCNPEDGEEEPEEVEPDYEPDYSDRYADAACDRYEQELDRRASQ